MKDNFRINGVNAGTTYGVCLVENGYKDIFAYPSLKNIEVTEWLDGDGVEADLSAPRISSRSITLRFAYETTKGLALFMEKLKEEQVCEFLFSEVWMGLALRLTGVGQLTRFRKMGQVSLTFVEDSPSIMSAEPLPTGTSSVTQRGYKIDEIDLSRFGCWVLDGSVQAFEGYDVPKVNLVTESSSENGQTYYAGQDIFPASREISLDLLINESGLMTFSNCWRALFEVLRQAGSHRIQGGNLDHDCYLKGCSVQRFRILENEKFWLRFTVRLYLTNHHSS